MGIIFGIVAVFLLLKSNLLSSFGVSTPLASGQPAPASFVPAPQTVAPTYNPSNVSQIGADINSGVGIATTALKAVPIVGQALSAVVQTLTQIFAQASAKRAKQAVNENTAVAAAVPGWDQSMLQIQTNYNNGGLTKAQAFTLVDLAWANYWNECGPQIQPGRNGCQGGQMPKAQADQQFPGLAQCSGSWGAACCVGYADLANGANSIKAALTQTDNTGSPAVAIIPAVFASKYGGSNRAQYTLTFVRPSSVFSI